MNEFLLYERNGAIVTLTMNQPEIRNVLTGNTAASEFVEVCAKISADISVKAVIITGAGPVFSSGGNVKDMRRFFETDIAPATIREWYRNGIQRIPKASSASASCRETVAPGCCRAPLACRKRRK